MDFPSQLINNVPIFQCISGGVAPSTHNKQRPQSLNENKLFFPLTTQLFIH